MNKGDVCLQFMTILQQYFHAIGTFNALFTALLLLSSGHLSSAGKTLLLWCLAWAVYMLHPLVMINAPNYYWQGLQTLALWIPACFGALFYLYLRLTIRNQSLSKQDATTLLPLLICLWLNYDYAAMSNQQFARFYNNADNIDIQNILGFIFLYGQAGYFLIRSYLLILDYKRNVQNTLSHIHPQLFPGLILVLFVSGSLWLIELSAAMVGVYSVLALMSDILFTLFLSGVGLLHSKMPHLLLVKQLNHDQSDTAKELRETKDTEKHTQKGVLDSDTSQQFFQLIKDHVEKQQAFLDSELTIYQLSQQLGLSKHYVSEAINKHTGKNFHLFINEYRVAWFCNKLTNNRQVKILDLALDSGFASKSAFNQVFKKVKGITPSQFKASVLA